MQSFAMKLPQFIMLGMTVFVFGCVHPKVTYLRAIDPPPSSQDASKLKEDYDGKIKFRLIGTRVVLGEKKNDPQDAKKTYTDIGRKNSIGAEAVSALVVPREDETALFAVIPQSQWLWMVETKLSVSYFDNTRLIQKIGVQVEDNRIKAIEAIGSVISAIAAAALKAPEKSGNITVPVAIDIDPDNEEWRDLPSNTGWYYRVQGTSSEPDAVERDKFFEKYSDGFFSMFSSTRSFPMSSCRQAYLKIGQSKDDDAALIILPIQIADYKKVRTYEMPDKGAISSHTLCGADITTEKSDVASNFEVLSTLVKQAKTIKDAQDAKKSQEAK